MAERNLNQIHEFISYVVRKERGQFVTDPEIDECLNYGQWDEYNLQWATYEKFGELPECLEPFKKTLQFDNATSVLGKITKPSDYQYYLNGYTITYDNVRQQSNTNAIVPIEDVELSAALKSQLRPVSTSKPKMISTSTTWNLYPQVPQAGYITYLKTPATPNAVYTYVGRDPEYDAGASTQLEWRDSHVNVIIMRALSTIGINLSVNDIVEYAEMKSKEESINV